MLRSPKPLHTPPRPCTLGKLSMSKIAWGDFIMSMVQKLLNIEQFYHWKFNKIIFSYREIGVHFWYCWKGLNEYHFMDLCYWEFSKNSKIQIQNPILKGEIVGVRVHTWGHNPDHSSTFELKNNIIKHPTHQYTKCIKTLLIVASK